MWSELYLGFLSELMTLTSHCVQYEGTMKYRLEGGNFIAFVKRCRYMYIFEGIVVI
jgi:hypothetical protein